MVAEVRMAVVPANEGSGAMTAIEVFAGNIHQSPAFSTVSQYDRVIALTECSDWQVYPNCDVGNQIEIRVIGNLFVQLDWTFKFLMVGSDTAANQAKRRGQAFVKINLNVWARSKQRLSGIKARRSASNDCNLQG